MLNINTVSTELCLQLMRYYTTINSDVIQYVEIYRHNDVSLYVKIEVIYMICQG